MIKCSSIILGCLQTLLQGLNKPFHQPIGDRMVGSTLDMSYAIALAEALKLVCYKLGTNCDGIP